MDVLEINKLEKSFKSKKVLTELSLSVKKGEILALLGENGSGKTTLIKILVGLLSLDSGQFIINGLDGIHKREEITRVIGYVGQDTERSAYARLTVKENLLFFGKIRGINRRTLEGRIEDLVDVFRFEKCLNTGFSALSGGQKQTMVIIRALLHDPVLIFLDEPTKGLDPVISSYIRNFLSEYIHKRKKALFLTSHIFRDVEEMADRVAFLQQGKISEIFDIRSNDISLEAEFYKRFSNTDKNKCQEGICYEKK